MDVPEGFHRHPNGGGLVADTADVAETAYIGPEAKVYGHAQVYDNAKVCESAEVYGGVIFEDDED
jgi:carbonic anhydrase/acetyltransferase-like protein (isoleucine patch superfamily)